MKITAIKSEQGLEAGKEYDLDQISARTLVNAGIVVESKLVKTEEISNKKTGKTTKKE